MRLIIPAIAVDTIIENVGITPEGEMDMPESLNVIGWYGLGQRPGNIGSAVIAGHYGVKAENTEAFNNINKLVKGDKIQVIDDSGNNITFVVQGSRSFDPQADTSDVFISNDGKAHLNLITCEGIWDKTTKSYSSRLVIFADKE